MMLTVNVNGVNHHVFFYDQLYCAYYTITRFISIHLYHLYLRSSPGVEYSESPTEYLQSPMAVSLR